MSKILSDEDGDTIWNDPTPSITNIDDELVKAILGKPLPDGYPIPNFVDKIKQIYTNKIKEAELRGAVNALYQLKADRVAHTLGNHPKDWTPEIDFIDHHIAQLTNQYKGEQDNE